MVIERFIASTARIWDFRLARGDFMLCATKRIKMRGSKEHAAIGLSAASGSGMRLRRYARKADLTFP